DTWVSTVRLEMNSASAIWAFVRCRAISASTSASRPVTSAFFAAPAVVTSSVSSLTLRRPVPNERPGRDPAGSCLLVRAAELGEGDREPDELLAVAGGDRGGPFGYGGGDRVVAGSVPASLDTGRGVGVGAEPGGLRPQRGVPRPVLPAAYGLEQFRVVDVDGESPHGPGRIVPMQREQAVEYRRPAQQASGELLGVGAEVDRQAYPGRPAAVVTAHAVHHRNGVRRTGQVRRDRTSGPLPALPEALSGSHDVVEMAG